VLRSLRRLNLSVGVQQIKGDEHKGKFFCHLRDFVFALALHRHLKRMKLSSFFIIVRASPSMIALLALIKEMLCLYYDFANDFASSIKSAEEPQIRRLWIPSSPTAGRIFLQWRINGFNSMCLFAKFTQSETCFQRPRNNQAAVYRPRTWHDLLWDKAHKAFHSVNL
jgi:hypothetical protein